MITYKMKVGNGMLEYSSEDPKKVHKFASVYGSLPTKCDCCGKTDLYLFHKSPKDNDYFGIRCKDCGAELTFHQYKEGGFYTTKEDKFKQFVAGEARPEPAKQTSKDNIEF